MKETEKNRQLALLDTFTKTIDSPDIEQVAGAIELLMIFLGGNCAGFTNEELAPVHYILKRKLSEWKSLAKASHR